MMKKRFAKRFFIYIVSAALIAGAGVSGGSFDSYAASYIQFDNIIIRDAANGEIQGGIAKGTEVEVVESTTGTDGMQWNHVKYQANGTTHEGWVRADLMTTDKSKIEPDEEPTAPEQGDTTGAGTTDTETGTDTDTDTDTADPSESEGGDLELVLPDASVSGEGYTAQEDGSFSICGETMTIAEDFSADKIPAHFEKGEITYKDDTVAGAVYKYGEISLVYLENASGQGRFFVYDGERDVVHSFIRITLGEKELILLTPPAEEKVSDSYRKTLYATDETSAVTAYQFAEPEGLLDIGTNAAEYFYVYGMTENGTADWYLIDDGEGTFIRATADLTVDLDDLTATEQSTQSTGDDTLEKMIIVVMAAVILLCIVLVILFAVRSARARKGYYDPETDEEEEDEEEELGFLQRRREEKMYRRFMENFDEEEDQKIEDLFQKKQVEEMLADQESWRSEPVQKQEPLKQQTPQETTVLPPVDTVLLKEIMAQQEAAGKASEVAEEPLPREEGYDIPVSDKEDYDLTDENTEADEKEFDEIENILLKGLSELEKTAAGNGSGVSFEYEEPQESSEKSEDEWKDLEFLDI